MRHLLDNNPLHRPNAQSAIALAWWCAGEAELGWPAWTIALPRALARWEILRGASPRGRLRI